MRVPDRCLEERESKETVLYPQGATLPHKGYYLVMNVSIIWNFHEFYLVDKAEKRVYLIDLKRITRCKLALIFTSADHRKFLGLFWF